MLTTYAYVITTRCTCLQKHGWLHMQKNSTGQKCLAPFVDQNLLVSGTHRYSRILPIMLVPSACSVANSLPPKMELAWCTWRQVSVKTTIKCVKTMALNWSFRSTVEVNSRKKFPTMRASKYLRRILLSFVHLKSAAWCCATKHTITHTRIVGAQVSRLSIKR